MEHPIKTYRHQRGLSLEAFAAMAETSSATVSRVENGLLKPTFDLLGRLVAATSGAVSADAVLEHARRAGRAPSSEAA